MLQTVYFCVACSRHNYDQISRGIIKCELGMGVQVRGVGEWLPKCIFKLSQLEGLWTLPSLKLLAPPTPAWVFKGVLLMLHLSTFFLVWGIVCLSTFFLYGVSRARTHLPILLYPKIELHKYRSLQVFPFYIHRLSVNILTC